MNHYVYNRLNCQRIVRLDDDTYGFNVDVANNNNRWFRLRFSKLIMLFHLSIEKRKRKLSYRRKSIAEKKTQRSPRVKICFVSFSHVSFYVLKGLSKYTEYTFNICVPAYISLPLSSLFSPIFKAIQLDTMMKSIDIYTSSA